MIDGWIMKLDIVINTLICGKGRAGFKMASGGGGGAAERCGWKEF